MYFDIIAEPVVREPLVPPAIPQPLVENAITCGATTTSGSPLAIQITARIEGGIPPGGRLITALIVDDERPARARIRKLLFAHPTVVVTGKAEGVDAGRRGDRQAPVRRCFP